MTVRIALLLESPGIIAGWSLGIRAALSENGGTHAFAVGTDSPAQIDWELGAPTVQRLRQQLATGR
jgi:hypothetical protein